MQLDGEEMCTLIRGNQSNATVEHLPVAYRRRRVCKTKPNQILKLPTLVMIEILMISREIGCGNQQLNIKSLFACTVQFPSQTLGKTSGNLISTTLL